MLGTTNTVHKSIHTYRILIVVNEPAIYREVK